MDARALPRAGDWGTSHLAFLHPWKMEKRFTSFMLLAMQYPVAFDEVVEQDLLGNVPTVITEPTACAKGFGLVLCDHPIELPFPHELKQVRDVDTPHVVPKRVISTPMPDPNQTDNPPFWGDLHTLRRGSGEGK